MLRQKFNHQNEQNSSFWKIPLRKKLTINNPTNQKIEHTSKRASKGNEKLKNKAFSKQWQKRKRKQKREKSNR